MKKDTQEGSIGPVPDPLTEFHSVAAVECECSCACLLYPLLLLWVTTTSHIRSRVTHANYRHIRSEIVRVRSILDVGNSPRPINALSSYIDCSVWVPPPISALHLVH